MANANQRKGNLEVCLEMWDKALLEDNQYKFRQAKKKVQKLKKKRDEQAYLDDDKSIEHKNAGNELYKAQKWVDAIAEYTEAIKRNPKNHAAYSNRAACYTKLMGWARGLEDCNKCIEIKPDFVKAYIRKGKIQHFLKQYNKALETYDAGLKLDPKCTDLKEGRYNTVMAIQRSNQSGEVDQQRVAEAMKDPEIVAILKDPQVNAVLKDMQHNPKAGQAAMNDPVMRAKINKLVSAGVLQVG